MKIGIFDSGIGGLSVLHQAMHRLPGAEFIYYADEAHVPYGEKTKAEILAYTDAAVQFLTARHTDAVVLACNTATSVAAPTLRAKYTLPIIGMEPAVKKALDLDSSRRVLVAATPVTIRGEKLHGLIERVGRRDLVDLLPMPGLVRLAESGIFEGEAVHRLLEEALSPFDLTQYSALVLGCTHFNLFKAEFRRILPDTMHFVDGNTGTVNQLIRRLQETGCTKKSPFSVTFYSSGTEITAPEALNKINRILEHLDKMYPIN